MDTRHYIPLSLQVTVSRREIWRILDQVLPDVPGTVWLGAGWRLTRVECACTHLLIPCPGDVVRRAWRRMRNIPRKRDRPSEDGIAGAVHPGVVHLHHRGPHLTGAGGGGGGGAGW